jgi:O-antigen/teichoic acid export membrane protein
VPDDVAPANVNRAYSLAGTSIAIFTFTLTFLFPRFANGEINDVLFQAALVVLGVATFSFVFAAFFYYGVSLGNVFSDADRAAYARRGDRLWLLGYTLLFLDPSVILAAVGLFAVGAVWFALWLAYLVFAIRYFPRVQTSRKAPISRD